MRIQRLLNNFLVHLRYEAICILQLLRSFLRINQ